jgi:hypothetical protein
MRLAWRRKRVRALTYILAVPVAVYVTFVVVWDPPNDDGPLPTLGGITETSRIEPLYTRIASDLTGRDVEVRCWSEADWAKRTKEVTSWTHGKMRPGEWTAYVSYDHERANLSPSICRSLGRWAYERRWPDDRREGYNFVWSVKVLAHETQHLRGIDNEAEADCYRPPGDDGRRRAPRDRRRACPLAGRVRLAPPVRAHARRVLVGGVPGRRRARHTPRILDLAVMVP